MKHLNLAFAAMAALAFTACSQEEEIATGTTRGYVGVMEGNSAVTRSYNGGSGAFKWSNGDDISVYTSNGFKTMTMTGGADTDKATYADPDFIPKDVAVFPTSSVGTYTNGTTTVKYPSERVAGEKVNDPMVAYFTTGATKFDFKHVGGVIRFSVLVPEGVNRFVVSSSNALCGDFTVDATDKNAPFVTTGESSTNNKVTFNFTTTTGSGMMTFILPLPTGTYTDLTVAVQNDEKVVKSKKLSVPVTMTRCLWNSTEINFGSYTGTIETMVSGVDALENLVQNTPTDELKSKSLTVDLNDETLTSDDAKKITNLNVGSISIKNGTVDNSALHIQAAGDISLKNIKVTGEFPKGNSNARFSLNTSGEVIIDGVDFSAATNYYNAIEVNLGANPVSEKVTIKNCKFAGMSNNCILVFGMPEGGEVNVENCNFTLNDGCEAVRISNKLDSRNFTVNVKDCDYKYTTLTPSNAKWAGFFLFEDYTTKAADNPNAKKQFTGLTVNCDNLTYDGEKITALTIGTNNTKQFACMCYDNANPYIITDKSHFPTFTFK